ncbi:hypothetical protein NC652_008098 [Populus alba x Populus x berolinensis]|nr:hypothetical protein NC651_007870 [Populus alba x Populus x berolinensis]KAJ6932283.1 hypothetical protein NC651_007876 [Populus alba x Populus x berolinensis]KAJ6932346.1 hypothetical protein NC651_007929 [Populus alba x Populus x berolinensis]KAJ6942183.1 hypothetical protein NC652_008098 [Populus alba x Populus x berolinensis]
MEFLVGSWTHASTLQRLQNSQIF